MDPILLRTIRLALESEAERWRERSPFLAALCRGLAAGPAPGVIDLCARYFRITAMTAPPAAALPIVVHYLALAGLAPEVGRFCASCGGAFTPGDAEALTDAADRALAAELETALDFVLSREPVQADPLAALPLAAGVLAAAERFGGGVSLVSAGAGTALPLLLDRYACRVGPVAFGSGPVRLAAELLGPSGGLAALASRAFPPIVGRVGLGFAPADLRDESERLAVQACLPPDDVAALDRFADAAAVIGNEAAADLRQGDPAAELAGLLAEAYAAMAPAHTLVLLTSGLWPRLSESEQRAVATAIQMTAARLAPHKPMAWAQVEQLAPGRPLDLRLHTFGWADPEDRAVRRLAEVSPDFRRVRWLE